MTVISASSSDPPFSRVGIVGLGLIGGSIALATRTAWPGVTIVGLDRSPETAVAAHRGVAHEVVERVADLAGCDLILIAAPLPQIVEVLPEIAAARSHAVVTDVGSTKRRIMTAARAAGLSRFVGGHPMAGSEHAGLGHARGDIFEGRPWLLVEQDAGADVHAALARFVQGLGGVPQWIDAETHDRTVAYISHLPQAIAIALMNAATDAVGESGLTAGGRAFNEMTRVASSPSGMWEAIFSQNGDFVAEALARFVQALPTEAHLRDAAWVREAFARAARARTRAGEIAAARR